VLRVLVVDDMAVFREPIQAVLRAEGFDAHTAGSGYEAVALMASVGPALVILDIEMPGMDGLAVLQHMRNDRALKATPVLILSAKADRPKVLEAAQLGISGYILKSNFSLKALLAKVRSICAPECAAPGPAAAACPESPPAPPRAAPVQAAAPRAAASTAAPRQAAAPRSLKDLQPICTRPEMLEKLKGSEDLKGFSLAVSNVLKLTASESASAEELSKAISQDPAMALKILRLANSSVYSRDDRVDTVRKAVLRIGMSSIRQTVLNIGVVERFSSPAFKDLLSTPHFWEHSIACGIIAAEIAHELKLKEADSAFTSGLLHDLGRMIMAEVLGDSYIEIIETSRALRAPMEVVETRMLSMSHAEIMDRLLSAWKFPSHLVMPIMHHHVSVGGARSAFPSRANDIIRLGLANRLAHAMLLGTSGNETIYPTEEHCRALGIEAATIRRIEETARQQTDDTKFALLTCSHGGTWPQRGDQVRQQLRAPFRPLYVSASPEIDAFRIFCAELAGPPGEQPPNIAVVHLASAKDREPLADQLLTEEQSFGLAPLPTLVLSPGGNTALPERAAKARRAVVVETPTAVQRFIDAVAELAADERQAQAA